MKAMLKETLMSSHDFTAQEAEQEINEMRNRVLEGEDPEEILYEYGLEPDYIFEILL
jgi:hypothetical protein